MGLLYCFSTDLGLSQTQVFLDPQVTWFSVYAEALSQMGRLDLYTLEVKQCHKVKWGGESSQQQKLVLPQSGPKAQF